MKQMKNIPKENIFQIPEGYFDTLAQRTRERKRERKARQVWISGIAAAAVLAVGMFFAISHETSFEDPNFQSNVDQDIELFISAGYWDELDILGMAENPNDLLDEIIASEWDYELGDERNTFIETEIFY
ncbi:hypothetical protein [Lunatibacter salilacus]|uniref:hypothetical protein n=1 Tax=Lunatibacter salilacus TaxID=2483804 RepID=UPI00131C3F43|nr:hypothetical protein [Lunatibacter salilacus]